MTDDTDPDGSAGPSAVALVVDGLADDGYSVVPGFLGPLAVSGLAARLLALDAAGTLLPAATGRGKGRATRPALRGDRTRWLPPAPEDESEALLFAALDLLRAEINAALQLGLFEFEGHYAIYPPGAGYERHRDVFRGEDEILGPRVVSCVLYLNAGWRAQDGGELALWLDDGSVREIVPDGGTLVAFLSDRFEHEVRIARRDRLAVTGWFRRRPFVPAV